MIKINKNAWYYNEAQLIRAEMKQAFPEKDNYELLHACIERALFLYEGTPFMCRDIISHLM